MKFVYVIICQCYGIVPQRLSSSHIVVLAVTQEIGIQMFVISSILVVGVLPGEQGATRAGAYLPLCHHMAHEACLEVGP